MRKLISILCILTAMMCLSSCGKNQDVSDQEVEVSEDVTLAAYDEIDPVNEYEIVKPDMRGDSIAGQGQAAESDSDALYGNMEKGRLLAYQTVLLDICHHQKFPGGRDLGYDDYYPMSDNKFALYDIDKDGSIELLVVYTTTCMAGNAILIYDYDSESDSVREQFVEFPSVTFFDNGILKADWSHNQGRGGRFWPYTLYQYHSEKDAYEAIARVDAWDKTLTDKDDKGNRFPDETDRDGDGLVYYIMDADQSELPEPVDLEEYAKWLDTYCKGADTIKISYRALTEENSLSFCSFIHKTQTAL